MPDLLDDESVEVPGSGTRVYTLRNTGGVYSCSCPAWRNQSLPIERRTCKHLRKYRGDEAEAERIGSTELPGRPAGRSNDDGPPVMLANKWEGDVDLTGWWMSEKLDGVRAYWDGSRFLSRLGNQYHAPDWFVERLPSHPLDGELWGGRGKFQRTISVVRRQDRSAHWKEITFLVFDAPEHEGPFEARLEYCHAYIAEHAPPYAGVVEHIECRGADHLAEELARIEGLGGEGLMLRQPASKYVAGRSSALLKVKSFQDAEARVVEHQAGAGRHKGRLGSLGVELPDGTRFSVGTGFSDAERENPPPIGSVITFRYQELTKDGVPRFPTYVGVRHDFAWPQERSQKKAPPPRKAKKKSPANQTVAAAADPARRRFELSDGKSNKFWEISRSGSSYTVRYGRIGTSGQARTKELADAAKATAVQDKLIAEKIAKGYVEVVEDEPAE